MLLFIRGVRGGADTSSVLNTRLEQVIGDWAAKKVPVNSRVINLIIGDSTSDDDGILNTARPLPAEEGILDKLQGLFGKRKLRESKEQSAFAKAAAQEPGVVTWTFYGFSKADEKAVIEELAKGIVKAHDAEAELNIVAKGDVGAAVLKAIKRLEGPERDGVKVGVNSLVIMGMDRARLRAYDPVYFSEVRRPLNLGNWTNVYGGGIGSDEEVLEFFSAKYDGKKLSSKQLDLSQLDLSKPALASRMSSSGLPFRVDALALAIIGVFGSGGLERWVSQQEWLEEQAAEKARRVTEAEEARRRAEEEAGRKAEKEARLRAEGEGKRKAAEDAAKRLRMAKMQWIMIPGGSFLMGSGSGNKTPRPRVRIKPFQMAKTEVTWGQYMACVDAGVCTPAKDGSPGDGYPVTGVDWNQARAFSEWVGGRLPSEAEWEYAARSGGRDIDYPWGNEPASCQRAVMAHGMKGCGRNLTWPVCSKTAGNTAQGLCDMAGNVWEWTQSRHHGSPDGAHRGWRSWESPGGDRVYRGGSWGDVGGFLRASTRVWYDQGDRVDDLGFRPVRDIR
ncbi:MAG: formylglycine-generating enzyme family protein [Elusimicrobiota bacterium]